MKVTSLKSYRWIRKAMAVLFWLLLWQALSMAVNQQILLVDPLSALSALFRMMQTPAYYHAIVLSFGRILWGFLLAVLTGLLLSILAKQFSFVGDLLFPLMSVIKSTPVASFVILALVWIRADNLSVFTSFLMVLPVIYLNVTGGFDSTDKKLLEMAKVFNMRPIRRMRAIYLPAVFPYFLTGCRLSLGICWKAGIAAEVISQPAGSIGDHLYRAKLFLSTDELFAWTLSIIVLSVLLEKAVVFLIKMAQSAYKGGIRP